MHPVRVISALIRSGKFGSERYGPGHVVGTLSGQPLLCGEEKVECRPEGWQGKASASSSSTGDEEPGLETKIIVPRSGSFRKLYVKKDTGEISTVGRHRMVGGNESENCQSVYLDCDG